MKKNKLEENSQNLYIDNDIEDDANKNLEETDLESPKDEIEDNSSNVEVKIEICKVLRIQDRGFIIDFKGLGIWIRTNGLIDKSLVPKDFIKVSYISDIGHPDFEVEPMFD